MTKREQFEANLGLVDPLTGCREWQGEYERPYPSASYELPVMRWYGRNRPAVEVGWRIYGGRLPTHYRDFVEAGCGNWRCVTPGHLRIKREAAFDGELPRGRPAYPAEEIAEYRQSHTLEETMGAFRCSRATVYRAVSQK